MASKGYYYNFRETDSSYANASTTVYFKDSKIGSINISHEKHVNGKRKLVKIFTHITEGEFRFAGDLFDRQIQDRVIDIHEKTL